MSAEDTEVFCRKCGIPMLPGPARAVGVCIDCIAASSQQVTFVPPARYASGLDTRYNKEEEELPLP